MVKWFRLTAAALALLFAVVDSGCQRAAAPPPSLGSPATPAPGSAGAQTPAHVAPAPVEQPRATGEAGRFHSLLVGVTNYPNLVGKDLQGPANDVVLIRELLVNRFHFKADDVVTLSEAEGKTRGAMYLPTRANIEREFRRLASAAGSGDQVFILMAGHGSQQPEDPKSPDPEPDGLDEIFLPRDVGKWDGGTGTVVNAIVDNDLGAWLTAIRKRQASVCLVMDSCHSGTMVRGAGQEVLREASPEADLGIPRAAIKAAEQRAAGRGEKMRGGPTAPQPPMHLAASDGLVAIYAAQAHEPTLEREMPPRAENGKTYGLLTYTLCQVLTQSLDQSAKPLTYRELAQGVQRQYSAWNRTSPTPVIEGPDSDREVLGLRVWPERSSVTLRLARDKLQVTAGSLNGLTRGSILSVSPPAGQQEQLLGHVRVIDVRVADADVEPCPHDNTPAKPDLPVGGACRVVYADYGDLKLRVAADPLDDGKEPKAITEAQRQRVQQAVQSAAKEPSLVQFVADPKQCDWLVRVLGGGHKLAGTHATLVPASGWSTESHTGGEPAFGPVPIDNKLPEWLKENLGRIARAENLKRLAGQDETVVTGDFGAKIQVGMRRGGKEIKWPSPDVRLFDDDRVVFTLSNPGKVAIDVTLLYVDSGYGITCLFPVNNEVNRLEPGEKVAPPAILVNSKTTGQEHLVVIAVRGQGTRVDFCALEQPTIDRLRNLKRGAVSPLQQLLETGIYAQGQTRGVGRPDNAVEHAMKLMTWQVMPQKRPAGE